MELDSIWDEPLTQSPQRSAAAGAEAQSTHGSPVKRRGTKLFLSSDSEGENDAPTNQPTYRARTPQKAVPDIDALFDDIDDDGELAPELDLDQIRRQAEARHAARGPPLTPHEILPSSSPTRELEDDAGAGASGKKKDGDGLEKNKKRKLPKLDDARLLGSDGFPALIKQAKGFKPRGKGHEVSDLNRLLQMYQFWTHKMYPKATFHDSVQRVEKLCHSKRMQSALGVWRDEYHGLINGRKPEEFDSSDDGSDSDNEDGGKDARMQEAVPSNSTVPAPEHREQRSSSPAPRPPSSASEFTTGVPHDDFDVDAILREEEKARMASASSRNVPGTDTSSGAQVQTAAFTGDDEDQAMWDELHALDDDPAPTAKPSAPAPPPVQDSGEGMDVDEDEDMWDVVREMEQEQAVPMQSKSATADTTKAQPATASAGSVAPEQTSMSSRPQDQLPATNDEGWDEMYL